MMCNIYEYESVLIYESVDVKKSSNVSSFYFPLERGQGCVTSYFQKSTNRHIH
jgi:hypothetical protein